MEGGWFTGGWDDVEKIADAIELVVNRVDGLPEDKKPPLTYKQQKAFDLICKSGPILGKDIIKRLPGIRSESTFTKHYVPPLKLHGIVNKRGLGYDHPRHYKPG
jgi:hypothetical protein